MDAVVQQEHPNQQVAYDRAAKMLRPALAGVARGADGWTTQSLGAAKMEVITAKMGVIRGIRHLTTFGGGKMQSAPDADNPCYAPLGLAVRHWSRSMKLLYAGAG